MSLITYEFKRADNAGEISQFRATLPILQEHYQGKAELVLYLSGKLNINGIDIDGLILKEDAIVLVEFKNYTGRIKALANGDWYHDNERINGGAKKKDGSSKTVFEQLQINRRALRGGLECVMKNLDACKNIQALVVFTKADEIYLEPQFTWGANAWVNVTDIERIADSLDTIKAKTQKGTSVIITEDEIVDFVRNMGFEERYIMTKYSDVNKLPSDLYHEEMAHNGDEFSPNTLLAKATEENNRYKESLHEAVELLQSMMKKMAEMAEEKDVIIQQQKAELLRIRAEQLQERQRTDPETTNLARNEEIESNEEKELLKEARVIEEEIAEIERTDVIETTTPLTKPKKRFGMKERVLKGFDVNTDSMDDDQLELIEKNLSKSMIVAGCAGSGKSVIAMHKAQQIIDEGGDVILIAYTKSLNRYMSQGKKNTLGSRFYYHWQWENAGKPTADYIIVDEIQDFEKKEIEMFVSAAKKCFFFFGDTAQSIYKAFGKKTMTIREISELTNIVVSYLYNNYRLPKPVAKITQDYLCLTEESDEVRRYTENAYLSKENTLPSFVQCVTIQEQTRYMILLIRNNQYNNVGILVPDNEMVLELMKAFTEQSFACEFKYNAGYNDIKNRDTLDFSTQRPKLMTYHSAKGLQFETVILPLYNGAKSIDECKSLYVAMTRTYRYLYILHTGDILPPLSNVPERLFNRVRL